MTVIKILSVAGSFAENKDVAKSLRQNQILPALDAGKSVVLDFDGVDSATQSFIHALISEVIRIKSPQVLEDISFKNCNETIKKIINIVVYYMQDPV